MFRFGDQLAIERTDGRSTFGAFKCEDDEYMVVTGTVGERIGQEIAVPKRRIIQVVILERKSR